METDPDVLLVRRAGSLRLTLRDRGVLRTLGAGPQHLYTLTVEDPATPGRAPIDEPALLSARTVPLSPQEVLASLATLLHDAGQTHILSQLDGGRITDEPPMFSGWIPQAAAENTAELRALARATDAGSDLLQQVRHDEARTRPPNAGYIDPGATSFPDAPTL